MKSFLPFLRLVAAVTLVTAWNLLRLSGISSMRLRFAVVDHDDDENAGFERTVLTGMDTMRRVQKQHLDDYSRFTSDTKKAFEDLTKIKNHFNSLSDFETSLKRLQLELRREKRMAFGEVAAFGDPKAHVIGIRTDFGFDVSDDFAFDAAKRMFRGLVRAGSKTRRSQGIALLSLAAS